MKKRQTPTESQSTREARLFASTFLTRSSCSPSRLWQWKASSMLWADVELFNVKGVDCCITMTAPSAAVFEEPSVAGLFVKALVAADIMEMSANRQLL